MRRLRFAVAATLVVLGVAVSAQGSRNEAGVQGTLRSIVSGQLTYAAVCGNFFYAPTLADLAKPEKGSTSGFIPNTDVPPKGAGCSRSTATASR